MALRRVLAGLVVVLVVLPGYGLPAVEVSPGYQHGPENDDDINGHDLERFSKKFDDLDREIAAGKLGAKLLQ